MRTNKTIPYVCVLLGIIVLVLQAYYYLSDLVYTSIYCFFIILMLIGGATLYIILFHSSKKLLVFFMILCTASFMNLTYVYFSQDLPYIPPLDAIYHWKTAETITASGQIDLITNATHIEFEYSGYPGFHIFISIITQITGVDSILFVKLLPLVYAILPFIIFIIVRRIFPSNDITAGLAAYIAIFLPKWYAFPSYSRFVIIYLLLLFYFIISLTTIKKRRYLLLALISMTALSITHHVTTYITIFFIIFTIIFSALVKKTNFRFLPIKRANMNTTSFRALAGLLVLGTMFPVLSSPVSFEYHFSTFLRYFSPGYLAEGFSTGMMGLYSTTEQMFILITIGIVGLVGLYGLIKYLRREGWNVAVVAITVFFGSIFALSLPTLYLNTVIYSYVAGRMTFILFIVISPFVAASLTVFTPLNRWRNFRSIAAFLLLLSLTFASVDLIPRSYIDFSQEKNGSHLWEVRENHDSLYSSLLWVQKNMATLTQTSVGDVPLVSIGYGMLNMNMQYYWPLFEDPLNGSEHFTQLTKLDVKYVFVNKLLSMYREQPEERRFIGPIPDPNLEAVTEQIWLNRIFDNSIIVVTCINRSP